MAAAVCFPGVGATTAAVAVANVANPLPGNDAEDADSLKNVALRVAVNRLQRVNQPRFADQLVARMPEAVVVAAAVGSRVDCSSARVVAVAVRPIAANRHQSQAAAIAQRLRSAADASCSTESEEVVADAELLTIAVVSQLLSIADAKPRQMIAAAIE